MFRALYTAASGMQAQQLNLDNVANNLANASTAGFRKRRLQFQDLLYQNLVVPGSNATSACISFVPRAGSLKKSTNRFCSVPSSASCARMSALD